MRPGVGREQVAFFCVSGRGGMRVRFGETPARTRFGYVCFHGR